MQVLSNILRLKTGSPKFNEALADVYIRPDQMNLTAIDSLMISAMGGSPQAVFFQIALNSRHGLKTDGLNAAFKALPARPSRPVSCDILDNYLPCHQRRRRPDIILAASVRQFSETILMDRIHLGF
jgi:hypothetical protein